MGEHVVGSITPNSSDKIAQIIASRVYQQPAGVSPPPQGPHATPVDQMDTFETETGKQTLRGRRGAGHDPLPFYTNPASRVEAATGIALGKLIDLRG